MSDQPDQAVTIELFQKLGEVIDGKRKVDAYNALVNLLGQVLLRSSNPPEQLMQTFIALSQIIGVGCHVEEVEQEEQDDERTEQSTH